MECIMGKQHFCWDQTYEQSLKKGRNYEIKRISIFHCISISISHSHLDIIFNAIIFWGFSFFMEDEEILLRKAHRMKQTFSPPSALVTMFYTISLLSRRCQWSISFFLKQHVSHQTYGGVGKNIHSFSRVSPNPFPISPSILNRISYPRIFPPLKFQHNFWSPGSTKNKGPGTDEGTTSQRFISAFPSVVGCWRIQQLQVQWTLHTRFHAFFCVHLMKPHAMRLCHADAMQIFVYLPFNDCHHKRRIRFQATISGFGLFPPGFLINSPWTRLKINKSFYPVFLFVIEYFFQTPACEYFKSEFSTDFWNGLNLHPFRNCSV